MDGWVDVGVGGDFLKDREMGAAFLSISVMERVTHHAGVCLPRSVRLHIKEAISFCVPVGLT